MINKKAVTLVEIMVVIMILAILSLVGFTTFKSYFKGVRDSTRLIEMENMNTSLSTYNLKSGFFPEPDNPKQVTYSGGLVFTQGTFGINTSRIIGYSSGVVDPLTKNEYAYSVKNSRKEFSIAAALEEDPGLVSGIGFSEETYAASLAGSQKGMALVTGNYNGEIVSLMLSGKNFILALPSIIASDLNDTDLEVIISNNRLVYNGYFNLPDSYYGTVFNVDDNTDFSPNELVLFSGSINELSKSYNQIKLLQNLFNSYSGSILGKQISINRLDYNEVFGVDPSLDVRKLACDIVNFKVNYFVKCGGLDFITYFVTNILNIDISGLPGDLESVFQDNNGNFVFGMDEGVAFYNVTTEQWIVYGYEKSSKNWALYDTINNPKDNKVEAITQGTGSTGDYWIGTDKGLYKISYSDLGTNSPFTLYDKGLTGSTVLKKNKDIEYIYTDTYGVIWVGTEKGVTGYNGNNWIDYTKKSSQGGLSQNDVSAIFSDSAGNIWFGTDDKGVDKYSKAEGKVVNNYSTPELPNKEIKYIAEDGNNNIWIGTKEGIGMTEDFGDTWTQFTTTSNVLLGEKITYIYADTSGRIWVGTKKGLLKYDGASWITINSTTFVDKEIFLIYEDESGLIVISYEDGVETINSDGIIQG